MGYLADHFRRVQAAKQAARSAAPEALDMERQGRTQYEQMLLLLDTHQQQLRNLQSMEARAAHKATLLAQYRPYLDGIVSAGKSQQDNVLVTLMLWHFDCALIGPALDLAAVALGNGMAMPEQHRRSLPTVVAEETADLLLAGKGAESVDQALAYADRAERLTEAADMPDAVRAKLLKAKGRALRALAFAEDEADKATHRDQLALLALRRAVALDKNVGVKKDIEQLERQIRNAAAAKAKAKAAA